MNKRESLEPRDYILDAFEPSHRIAILALNRGLRETVQRITSAAKAASPEFQAWLRYKNANGADIYIGMNPLKTDAATRTKEEIDGIRHVYIDLDYGGEKALEAIHQSSVVPKPNVVLTSSPTSFKLFGKWKASHSRKPKHCSTHYRANSAATQLPRMPPVFYGYPALRTRNMQRTSMWKPRSIPPK